MPHRNCLYRYLAGLSPREQSVWLDNMLVVTRRLISKFGYRPFSEDPEAVFNETWQRIEKAEFFLEVRDVDSMTRYFAACLKYTIFNCNHAARRQQIQVDISDAKGDIDKTIYRSPTPNAFEMMATVEEMALIGARLKDARLKGKIKKLVEFLPQAVDAGLDTKEVARHLDVTENNARQMRYRVNSIIKEDDGTTKERHVREGPKRFR